MTSSQIVSLFSLASILTFSACNGGGGSAFTGGREMCAKVSPIAPDRALTKDQAELSLDPAAKQLPPGVYSYKGATLYYVDKATGVHVQMSDVQQGVASSFKAMVDCYRGAYPGMSGINVQAQGISEMRVEADGKIPLMQKYNFNFKTAQGVVVPEFSKSGDPVAGAPKDVFDDPNNPSRGLPLHFVKTSPTGPTQFELRTSGVTATNGGSYDLVIRLERADLPPVPAPNLESDRR